MQITTKEIKDNVLGVYYKRGVEYYAMGRVLEYKAQTQYDEHGAEHILITGKVRGGGGMAYAQEIDICLQDYEVVIEGNCSCPVDYNCKHVAAVCIKYNVDEMSKKFTNLGGRIASPAASASSLVDTWLENLQKSTSQGVKKADKNHLNGGEYFLTYRLDGVSDYEKGKLSFYKSKKLKNGSISKGTKLDGYKAIHQYSYRELKNEQDENILSMANALFDSHSYNPSMQALSGTLGYVMAKEVVSTGRCYYDVNQTPLRWSDELYHATFEFKLYKGEYGLKSNIGAKVYRLLETLPPLLLDSSRNTLQEIDVDMNTYKQLLNAPKIPIEEISKVCASIGRAVPNLDVQTPKGMKTTVIDAKPIPKIHLKYAKEEEEKSFNSLSVNFNYGDYVVKYSPRTQIKSFYVNNAKVEIKRDLAYEEEVKRDIEAFGFDVEIQNDNLAVVLKNENRQTQLKAWREFLESGLQTLEEKGWLVEADEEFDLKFEPSCEVVVENEDKNDWFSLSFNIEFNGVSQPIAPLVTSIIEEFDNFENMPEFVNVEVSENHFVEVQTKQIKPIINTIIELLDKKDKDGNIKVSPFDAHLIDFMDEDVVWRGNKEILELSSKLKDYKGVTRSEPPKCLAATLRDYQQEGLNWLNFLYEFKFGGILADDMGLGKTIQTLAHLSKLKEEGKLTGPSLIVMPTSLIANWKNEAKKFTPNLTVLSLHGLDRAEQFSKIEGYDLLLTTYPLLVRDEEKLNAHKFFYIILDEAQKIKNHKTKMAITLKTFKSEHRLALSGTPIENHLGELWSIFSFLMPGFLDTLSFFKNFYQTPIEKEHSFEKQNLLNKRVKPFMVRRTKEKVAHELPAKSEIIKYTQFESKQSKLYESIRVTMEKKVRDAVASKGLGSSHITILDALLKLRQVCCDPSLLKIDEAKKVRESAKLELLLELVDELLQEGRKILLFSQFTSMLAIIEEKIIQKEISYSKLTGSTIKREEAIEKFTSGKADVFLISLKAGGVGLNLVEADTVIHYDPWWNPAVENKRPTGRTG